jgi:hypothetical protein
MFSTASIRQILSFLKPLKYLNMKTLFLLFVPAIAVLGLGLGFIETTTLSGTVKDHVTGEYVAFATVNLEQKGVLITGSTTNAGGHYSMKGIASGTYDIKVNYVGYKTVIRSGIEMKNSETVVEDFLLEATSEKLSDVTITREDATTVVESDKSFADEIVGFFSLDSKSSAGKASTDGAYDMAPAKLSDGEASPAKTYSERISREMKSIEIESSKAERESKAKMMAEPEKYSSAGKLTAGNWCDNRNWSFFQDVLKKSDWSKMKETWKFNPEERYVVKVKKGKDIAQDVPVRLKDRSGKIIWETRTDNKGEAFLFANIFENDEKVFEVEVGDKTNFISQTIGRTSDKIIEIDFAAAAKPSKVLDIMFMIDATGSMGDEMEYISEELNDVISRVKRTQQQMLTVRVSNNVYRDKGDDYVVRSFPFTENMSVALSQLNEQSAGGGGDYEEAVEEGFDDAINKHEWSTSAAARLMFFVLDAPPHLTNENIKRIQEVTKIAAAKGIRVIPVASSGVDKNTEFLMRFLSVSTGGTYVFLTDHSGIGNSHIEPTIGKYDVEYLNDLLVKVINSYLEEEDLLTKK